MYVPRSDTPEHAYPRGQLQRHRSFNPKENGSLQMDKNGIQVWAYLLPSA